MKKKKKQKEIHSIKKNSAKIKNEVENFLRLHATHASEEKKNDMNQQHSDSQHMQVHIRITIRWQRKATTTPTKKKATVLQRCTAHINN